MKPIPPSDHPIIDIGANLTHKSFRRELPKIVDDAHAVGVSSMVVTGTSIQSSRDAEALCRKHPGRGLLSTAGIHPHDSRGYDPDDSIDMLRVLSGSPHVVAIGECGLDFDRDFSARDVQAECFRAQLDLAAGLELPVFLHEREAHTEFTKVMAETRNRLTRGGVVHCFTGSESELFRYLDLDLHFGITGWICDELRGKHLREVVRKIPRNRLMIETDAPFLAPRDLPESVRRNEPRFLPHILRVIAECRGENSAALAESTHAVTREFFKLEDMAELRACH